MTINQKLQKEINEKQLNERRSIMHKNTLSNKSNMEQIKKKDLNGDEPANNLYDSPRFIWISDITDIALGCNTTEVMQKNLVPIEFDHICFSVIT